MSKTSDAGMQSRTVQIPGATIVLAPREHYAGIVIGADGVPSHHLILLPGYSEGDWKSAKGCAVAVGGELPSRR